MPVSVVAIYYYSGCRNMPTTGYGRRKKKQFRRIAVVVVVGGGREEGGGREGGVSLKGGWQGRVSGRWFNFEMRWFE